MDPHHFSRIIKQARLEIAIGDVTSATSRLFGYVQACELSNHKIPDDQMGQIEMLAGSCAAADMDSFGNNPALELGRMGVLV